MFIYFFTLLLLKYINLNNIKQVRVLGLLREKLNKFKIID
jgi:hypothetical protein